MLFRLSGRLSSASRAGLMVSAVLSLLVVRVLRKPLAPYGDNGAELNEHLNRLNWATRLGEMNEGVGLSGSLDLLRAMESGFPPGLYLYGVALQPFAGLRAETIGPLSGTLVLLALLIAVSAVAWGLTRRAELAAAACIGTALLPGLHGSALRYYFDLPMTAAVWSVAALLLLGRGRSVLLPGMGIALMALAACLIKWTALPYLLPVFFGLCFVRPADTALGLELRVGLDGGTAKLAGWSALLWLGGVGGYLALVGSPNSLTAMAQESSVVAGGAAAGPAGLGDLISGVFGRVVSPASEGMFGPRVSFYLLGLVTSVLSPLLALLGLVFLSSWVRRGAPAWPLLAGVVLGHLIFLLVFVRPTDERFLLTLAPALVLVGVLGWDGLPPPWRRRLGFGFCGLGLLVALDFHHFAPTVLTPVGELALHPEDLEHADVPPGPLRPRGLGGSSSVEGRGWARADEELPWRSDLREIARGWLRECPPGAIGVYDGDSTLGPSGDHIWLEYILTLDRLESGSKGLPSVTTLDCGEEETLRPEALLWSSASERRCPVPLGWEPMPGLPDELHARLQVHRRVGGLDCGTRR